MRTVRATLHARAHTRVHTHTHTLSLSLIITIIILKYLQIANLWYGPELGVLHRQTNQTKRKQTKKHLDYSLSLHRERERERERHTHTHTHTLTHTNTHAFLFSKVAYDTGTLIANCTRVVVTDPNRR